MPADVPEEQHPSLKLHAWSGMTMIVVDASVLVTAVADDTEDGERARKVVLRVACVLPI